ncbi:hypothetical protein D6833_11360 [Candidatus Parcubacteria bacterium]|nr:MAG: hypothetical protein D6833_11360 [Candidatus Parcubacteria bacterium]
MNDRIRRILEDLEAVRENLLALSDDIWLSIDHNDPQALEEGVEFKRKFNEKFAAFDCLASEISGLIQQFTSVTLDAEEQTGAEDEAENRRIIQQLNREEPHHLDEDFTYKRPYGYILDGQGATGIMTWQRLYYLVLRQLYQRDRDRFRSLRDEPEFISPYGHRTFDFEPAQMHRALQIADDFYAECNLSANGICKVIAKVLAALGIPKEQLKLFLREDRNAGRDQG